MLPLVALAITAATSTTATTVGAAAGSAAVVGTGWWLFGKGKEKGYEEGFKEGHKEGFKNGEKAGFTRAEEQFVQILKNDDDFKIATFALGISTSLAIDGRVTDEKMVEIEAIVGRADSPIHKPHVREKLGAILKEKPNFDKVRSKYLYLLSTDKLKELDQVVKEIILSDEVIKIKGKIFYNNSWKSYLLGRGITGIKSI